MNKKKEAEKENIIEETYDEMTQFEDFFVAHWEKILNVAIAIVIASAVYFVYSKISGTKDIEASAEFARAKTVQELQKAIGSHPSNPSANYARLKIAKLLVAEKKYDDALKACREITQVSGSEEAYWQAKLDEGYILELMGKMDEAAESFSKLGPDIKFPVNVRNEASYSAGRIFLSNGKKDRALASLKSIDLSSPTVWSEQAKGLLRRID
ncbi:MAG TPA: hypothetical protein DCZ94_19075 [Lentisphaeria bacterium]|nr:MAG: hypothetical protein A2X48_08875 [Lentisphaerae bacterium GWF2_49_21]HBC89048.1 hypothetical protein [Lentisphaeria bacterium]